MFDADRPIQKSEQDRLGRTVFAKYLARCILDHTSPDSLVIGLYGGWGAGKTSVINLMLEELHYASNHMFEDEMPIILNFSAWSYSGQNQLVESFFR
ncbi:MAG: NTPase, partial [Gammaproteobacteria bacterium]|nr:NTPase [Gammaproteobacteria bacterium]